MPKPPPPQNLSVLIADARPMDRQVLKGRLSAAVGWPLDMTEAADQAGALARLKDSPCDLVFLDRQLPGGETLGLLDRIRQLHPKSAVIAVCADPDAQWAVAAMKRGALDCLVKGSLAGVDFSPILNRLVQTRDLVTENMEMRQAGRMKDGFIAHVSRELREPLTEVLGCAHTLQSGILGRIPPTQKEAVDFIVGRTNETLVMLDSILRAREAAQGRRLAQLKLTDLCVLWRASLAKAEASLRKKRLSLEDSASDKPVWVMADAAALAEVCDHLVANAIKFSPEEGVLRLAAGASGSWAWAMLQDQGPGIAPELLPRVFDGFSGGTAGGLGLGLAVSKQIIELHSGTIWLDSSEPGTGCTAHLSLPLAAAKGSPAPAEQPALSGKHRVLIVEDNPEIVDIVRLFLSGLSNNLELTATHSGYEALVLIQNQGTDLVLLDVMLPDMNGLELLSLLRNNPATAKVKVLVMTGYTDAAERAREAGAQEVLVKPFDRGVFVGKVIGLLQRCEAPAA